MSTTAAAPAVFCPDWCSMPMSEHLEELAEAGTARHESAREAFASYAQCLYADGAASSEPVILLALDDQDLGIENLTAERCRELAADLIAAAEVMEAQR